MTISLQLMEELSFTLHGAPHASSAEIFCRYRKSYFGLLRARMIHHAAYAKKKFWILFMKPRQAC